ncbi:hypothetical protein [Naasia aerilata]|uniref:Uncharacterized protein n=1 Tax=Naasia aerilata TaxID=1162966 RepID=A0ABN6XV68_9MICO|nr:hypothetical protein [Naasia aerilata]BDZ47550.1 hypothetical protein GCM10025866_34590 [Naasia aerilata]
MRAGPRERPEPRYPWLVRVIAILAALVVLGAIVISVVNGTFF